MGQLLFSPLKIRDITLRNRVVVSPMCQYSSEDGFATDWHLVHLGSRAVGGAGLVITEATAVEAIGRISPNDLGIWKDEHIPALARITSFVSDNGAVPGIQLAHAGRKGSTPRPWDAQKTVPPDRAWTPVGPGTSSFASGYPEPIALDEGGIARVVRAFADAASRALTAGFRVIELHAAHGYLLHEFLSPLSNQRTDQYGGSFANRIRFAKEVVRAVRRLWPENLPILVRVSATDWVDGGWDIEQTVALAKELREEGVDAIDCSSGGNVSNAQIPAGPGFQTVFAERIRREALIPTGAVGFIRDPHQAEHILRTGQADLVVIAREFLRNPYWPLHAAHALQEDVQWPVQYQRAKT